MAFALPRFQKFCCCLPLKTGSLIIGYISMVFSSLFLAGTSFSIYKVAIFVAEHKNDTDIEHSPEEIQRVALGLYITHAYLILVFLYYFIISLFLVIGVHLNKINFLKYYFNTGLVLLFLALASVVVSTVFLHYIATIQLLMWCDNRCRQKGFKYYFTKLGGQSQIRLVTPQSHILYVTIFYCLIVVRSTYLEIEEQSKPREFEMQHLYNPIRVPSNMY